MRSRLGGSELVSGAVFICYRRLDTAPYAGRIADFLAREHPAVDVFMDITGILPGDDFEEVIRNRLGRTDVVLALIGERWLAANHTDGSRRIDDPKDILRLELSVALAEKKRVIPILLDAATMPKTADLPEPLQALARRNAYGVRHEHFESDLRELAKFIGNLPSRQVGEHRGIHPEAPKATTALIASLMGAFRSMIETPHKFMIIKDAEGRFVQFTDVVERFVILDLPTQPLKPRQLLAANRLLMERFDARTLSLGDEHFAFQTQVLADPEYLTHLTLEVFEQVYGVALQAPTVTFG